MREIAYYVDELVMLCEEYKAVARKNAAVERLDGLRDAILSIIEKLQPGYTSAVNADSAFFAGELDSNMGEKRVQYPTDDVIRYMERRKKRRADAEEEAEQHPAGGRHGNTKLPFGLCQREGIRVNPKWTPRDAWDALAKKGYDVGAVYRELKETGKVSSKMAAASTPSPYKRTEAQAKTISGIIRKTANLKKEQYRIVDGDGNVVLEGKGDRHEVKSTVGQKREHLPGNVSIHNHPDGGTFSADDLSDFGYGAREIVVASPEGEYSLVNAKYETKERYEGWHAMREAYEKACPNNLSGYEILQKARKNLENCEELQQMNAISHEFVQRKDRGESLDSLRDWLATTDYNALEAKYKEKLKKEQRRIEVEPHDRFMKENAEKYGFIYTFTPAHHRQSKGRSDSTDYTSEDQAAAIEAYRRRRQNRLDAKAQQEEGRWVTTENDHKVHINEEGIPDKGNPHVLAAMRGEGRNPKTQEELARHRSQRRIAKVKDAIKQYDDTDKAINDAKQAKYRAEKEFRRNRLGFKSVDRHKEYIKNLGYGEGDLQKMEDEYERLGNEIDQIKGDRRDFELSESERAKVQELDGRRNQVDFGIKLYDECYGPDAFTQEKFNAAEKKLADAEKAVAIAEARHERARKSISEATGDPSSVQNLKLYSAEERKSAIEKIKGSQSWSHMPEEGREKALSAVENASDAELRLLEKTSERAKIYGSEGRTSTGGADSWYQPGSGAIYLSEEDMSQPRVVWHEYGHFLDDKAASQCGAGKHTVIDYEYEMSLSDTLHDSHALHTRKAAGELNNLLSEQDRQNYMIATPDDGEGYIGIKDLKTGQFLEGNEAWSALDHLTNAVNEKFRQFYMRDPEYDEYVKSIGYPTDDERPKAEDYIEFYVTPKRKLQRQRDKYPGASEEYHQAVREYYEKREQIREAHPEFGDMVSAYTKRMNERESRIGPVSDILCGMMHGEGPWIFGGHSSEYYHSDSRKAYMEAVANYHQMRVMGWNDAIKLLHNIVPSVADRLEEEYNVWLWRNV